MINNRMVNIFKLIQQQYGKRMVFAALVCLVSSFASCSNMSQRAVDISKQKGGKIVAALNTFHQDQGYYPSDINDLVPNYVSTIEPPVFGSKKWTYSVFSEGNFQLSFEGRQAWDSVYYYKSKNERWHVDTR